MAEIVFKYEYRYELYEEDYNKIVKYADENEITLEDAYLQLKNDEIDDYMDFANSELIELEIN